MTHLQAHTMISKDNNCIDHKSGVEYNDTLVKIKKGEIIKKSQH